MNHKTLLRLVVCGSPGEGMSTLIGRLLESPAAEQEQGITIAAAHRSFSTDRRKFIITDSSDGQYTLNMVTGTPPPDAVVVLVDARHGVLAETRRHSYLVSLIGVRHVALAVNKMDLVSYSEARFRQIETEYRDFAKRIRLTDITCIPLSALRGDNILMPSANIPWHDGATLMGWLEAVEVDNTTGHPISASNAPAQVAGQFEATIVWISDQPLLRGRSYLMKIGPKTVTTTIAPIKYQVNVNTLEHVAAEKLELDAIGVCELELDQAIGFDPYAENRDTGGFVLIDRITNNTVGAGMLRFALRRAHNIHLQHLDVDMAARAAIKHQKPCLLWFTGLSSAGKSTIANLVEKKLHSMGYHTYLLDGDNVRHGLNKDLGFTAEDRVENIRRTAEVGKLMLDAGLIVLAAFISPFRAERRMARSLVRQGAFVEVFVNTPLHIAEQRDRKGLYRKARRGELKNFTGIDSPYEEPEAPEITLDTVRLSPEESAGYVIEVLRRMDLVRDAVQIIGM